MSNRSQTQQKKRLAVRGKGEGGVRWGRVGEVGRGGTSKPMQQTTDDHGPLIDSVLYFPDPTKILKCKQPAEV